MEKEIRIYIDLDGTICDIKKSIENFRSQSSTKDDLAFKYPWSQPGFFLDLDPLPFAIHSVNFLSLKYDVWFLSRPSFRNTNSYSEKAEWIKKHFGYEMQKKLILSGDKSLLCGRILIDDSDNANQRHFDGIWIRFGSDEFPDWDSVLRKVEEIANLKINSL